MGICSFSTSTLACRDSILFVHFYVSIQRYLTIVFVSFVLLTYLFELPHEDVYDMQPGNWAQHVCG